MGDCAPEVLSDELARKSRHPHITMPVRSARVIREEANDGGARYVSLGHPRQDPSDVQRSSGSRRARADRERFDATRVSLAGPRISNEAPCGKRGASTYWHRS